MAKQVQQQTQVQPANKTASAKAKTENRGTKADTGKEVKAKVQEVRTVFLPSNPPTSGRYLFAFTAAVMALVGQMPKAKQSAVAKVMHGSTALRHHGKDGTRKIVCNEDGTVAYDKGYFAVGAKSLDEKRRAVPDSYVRAFAHYFDKGEFPPAVDGFAFKASGKKTLNIGLK